MHPTARLAGLPELLRSVGEAEAAPLHRNGEPAPARQIAEHELQPGRRDLGVARLERRAGTAVVEDRDRQPAGGARALDNDALEPDRLPADHDAEEALLGHEVVAARAHGSGEENNERDEQAVRRCADDHGSSPLRLGYYRSRRFLERNKIAVVDAAGARGRIAPRGRYRPLIRPALISRRLKRLASAPAAQE
jgi:hypothetical protein